VNFVLFFQSIVKSFLFLDIRKASISLPAIATDYSKAFSARVKKLKRRLQTKSANRTEKVKAGTPSTAALLSLSSLFNSSTSDQNCQGVTVVSRAFTLFGKKSVLFVKNVVGCLIISVQARDVTQIAWCYNQPPVSYVLSLHLN